MLQETAQWIVDAIGQISYLGVAALMFLESSFFPFPSEIVVPPAGYLAAQKTMDLWLVILAGTGGSLLGGLFNYWLALAVGRPFLLRYGRYIFISPKSLHRAEVFFDRHGHISTFIARLLPGVRQYISLPAGLARMDLFLFSLFTALGAGCWVAVLALLGFWFGRNPELVSTYLRDATLAAIGFSVLLAAIYLFLHWRKKGSDSGQGEE
ncbi:MAG: DedA family protein [Desulfohalobiaceae bacterium]